MLSSVDNLHINYKETDGLCPQIRSAGYQHLCIIDPCELRVSSADKISKYDHECFESGVPPESPESNKGGVAALDRARVDPAHHVIVVW
jgi:hypothetical protein